MSRNAGVEIISQEAEIERFGQPMFKYHLNKISKKVSEFNGIAIASRNLIDHDVLKLINESDVPVWAALENSWLN
jgi:hypothetical protein